MSRRPVKKPASKKPVANKVTPVKAKAKSKSKIASPAKKASKPSKSVRAAAPKSDRYIIIMAGGRG